MFAEKIIQIEPIRDKEVNLSTAASKTQKKWKNQAITWSDFLDRLNTPTLTQETSVEYQRMAKTKRDEIKDVGGFVGGFLKNGKRSTHTVQSRSLITLDADSPTIDLWDAVTLLFEHGIAAYSTHSHTPEKPRLRLIIPMKRIVTPDEYEPIARAIAKLFGMDHFDDTTYQASRLMFWPSCPRDGEYIFEYQDLPWLDPDEILASYEDWKDVTTWPQSSREAEIRKNEAKKQGNPLEKTGVVGAFCRTYDIPTAIETFLPDIYLPTEKPDRYTFAGGSTNGGLVLYQDGLFAYSNHGTDPVGGQLTNAFDLVRIHLFGDKDEKVNPDTNTSKCPSFQEMVAYVQEVPEVFEALRRERLGEASDDFGDLMDPTEEGSIKTGWLSFSKSGDAEVNTYLLAKEVASEIPTFYDGVEFLRYDENLGIWKDGAEEYLKSYLTNTKLINESKIRTISETIASIRNLMFTEKAFGNGAVDKLVLANGVYNLKDDSFTNAFDKEIHARVRHPIVYDPAATCPMFKGFVSHIAGEENLDFVFEWFGYNLYRDYSPIQKMLFLWGKGGTGKSTLSNLLAQFVGVENTSAVTLKHLMTERFAPANLHGKVANFDTDAKPQYLADGAVLKMLTGEDQMYADRKNREPITFYNYAKLTFAMNELPPMRDFSGGLKRRMMILKIDKVLGPEIKKLFPLDVIQKELPGIFNEAMIALRRALKVRKFTEAASMTANVEAWEADNDVVALFIEDECELGEDLSSPVKEAYADYQTYCRQSGYKALSRNKFSQRMEELGYGKKAVREGAKVAKSWIGISTETSIEF